MDQLHRRLTDEQIKVLLQSYNRGKMSRAQVQELLGVGKTRFFAMMKSYRQDPDSFSIAYERSMPARLSAEVEAEIEKALLEEKEIVQDPDLPISSYNYTALRDRLKKKWTLITSIDDYSRKILFADFVPRETTWAHIQAAQALIQSSGLPLR
jgi:transposase